MSSPTITPADIERRRLALYVAENRFDNVSGVLAVNSQSVLDSPLTQYAVDSAVYGVNVATFRLNSIVRRAKSQASSGLSLFCPEGLDGQTNRGSER